MMTECRSCAGTGYQDQSTRCYRCNGKGFTLDISHYEVTNITDESSHNINSTQVQSDLS